MELKCISLVLMIFTVSCITAQNLFSDLNGELDRQVENAKRLRPITSPQTATRPPTRRQFNRPAPTRRISTSTQATVIRRPATRVRPTVTRVPEVERAPARLMVQPIRSRCPLDMFVPCEPDAKYRRADGSCNSLRYPYRGKADTIYTRWMRPEYNDRVNSPRSRSVNGRPLPAPRAVSKGMMDLSEERDRDPKATIFTMVWGQFIDHDTDMTKSPANLTCCAGGRLVNEENPECIAVRLEKDDPMSKGHAQCFDMSRSTGERRPECSGERVTVNVATSWIDGSMVYGSDRHKQGLLRSFSQGKLRMRRTNNNKLEDILPEDRRGENSADCLLTQPCFLAGDPRANEWVGLTAMHTMFVREHNRIAEFLYKATKSTSRLTDIQLEEEIFQKTRRIVAAEIQAIHYNEWLPTVLPDYSMNQFRLYKHSAPRYTGDSTNPAISVVFSSAAYRFGHTLIPDGFTPVGTNNKPVGKFITMDNLFNQPDTYRQIGNDGMMRAFATQHCQGFDHKVSSEIRDNLFRKLHRGMPHDLLARNIMRGREHGLPSYNKWRRHCGLSVASSFEELDMTKERIKRMKEIYEDVNDIDAFIGFISERKRGLVGATLACLLGRQFESLKRGDRFFYTNARENPYPFTRRQVEQLNRISLSKIVCDNHDIDMMPENAFSYEGKLTQCNKLPGLNLDDFID